MVVIIYFLGTVWFNTRYKIEKSNLKVSCGHFKKSIDIQEIKSIRNTKNIFTAPSLSFNRIEIRYGNYESIQVSPVDRQAFISELGKVNPNIELDN
ncbi:PH domain-containing protein [Peribacillus faecalis]|uniref:PH domain-containing protein n=1 Tax=Peribacillus faecalis TaxID=2772559 RepID=UPI001F2D7BAE|nr:PH domain-containing protein [Peribacillus faecalis]